MSLTQYLCFNLALAVLILFIYDRITLSDKYGQCPWLKNSTSYGCFSYKNYRPDFTIDLGSTLPYVSGANFILFADYVFDFHVKNIQINRLKDGDVIYVKADYIGRFFRLIYPKIRSKIILITHNSDASAKLRHIEKLDDPKLLAWFGENPEIIHPKLVPTPIGLENPNYYPFKTKFIRGFNFVENLIPWNKRKYLLYVNFNADTNRAVRQPLLDNFKKFGDDVFIATQKADYATYMSFMGNSKYVLCPRGNGLDTHRYYEAILMGSIPIVENSTLYPIFKESTTFVLKNFMLLTLDMLKKPDNYISNMNFSNKILLWQTWVDKVNSYRSEFLKYRN